MRTSICRAMMAAVVVGMLVLLPVPGWAGVGPYVEVLPSWSHVGSACTIDESSLKVFLATGPTLSFKAGVCNPPLIARCNVLNPLDLGNPDWNGLIVDYRDPDGKGTAYRVMAFLKAYHRSTGLVSTIAAFDSNSFGSTVRAENAAIFNHAFSFLDNEYYVEIQIYRSNLKGDPYLRAVRLATLY